MDSRASDCSSRNFGWEIEKKRKLALSREDDKRVICLDYISTVAEGHHRVSWNPLLGYVVMT